MGIFWIPLSFRGTSTEFYFILFDDIFNSTRVTLVSSSDCMECLDWRFKAFYRKQICKLPYRWYSVHDKIYGIPTFPRIVDNDIYCIYVFRIQYSVLGCKVFSPLHNVSQVSFDSPSIPFDNHPHRTFISHAVVHFYPHTYSLWRGLSGPSKSRWPRNPCVSSFLLYADLCTRSRSSTSRNLRLDSLDLNQRVFINIQ